RQRVGMLEGFVLEAASGEPISGAEVSVWHLNNSGERVADPALTTDANGFFSMKSSRSWGYLFRARHHGQDLATPEDIRSYYWQDPDERNPTPRAMTIFFTDRTIY